jgi:hypothetical protein
MLSEGENLLIELEIRIDLLRVCEMDKFVIEILNTVLLGGKSDNGFIVEVDFQRSHAGDDYIESHVPLWMIRWSYLIASNQMRIVQVSLNDALCVIGKFTQISEEEDFASSAKVGWFADPNSSLLLFWEGIHIFSIFIGQYESHWGERIYTPINILLD